KIDRDATARLCAVSEPVDEPPRPGLETGLAAVWAELLGCPPPGRGQSFFALGGDSLLATRLVAVVRDRFGADVPLRDLLARPTVADLAVAVGARLDPDLDHMDFWADFEEGEL
ncbi:phosphopantetheine-binding protein, partial [Planotetraspora sp. A-T 1434]|uniref:phosphopantetheine-binding protein n=1 Tax=Planotetraspora sp. A-T 1434 TaxID=2979219 RepID=UPI0021BE8F6C